MNEYKNDLFDELTRPGRKHRVPKSRPVAKRYQLQINISYEHLIFSVIVLIMAMVLVFSIGTEKGRRISQGPVQIAEENAKVVIKPEPKTETVNISEPPEAETVLIQEPKAPLQEPIKTPAKNISKPYTIQVATFWSKENAKKEVEKLRKKGFESSIISHNNKYQLCVGAYVDKDSTSGSMEILKKDYKDCFVRRR